MRLLVIDPPSKTLAPPSTLPLPPAELASTLFAVSLTLLSVPGISRAPEPASAFPVAAARALLPSMTSLLSATELLSAMSMCSPAEDAEISPIVLVAVATLPLIELLLIVTACTLPVRCIPPAGTPTSTLLGNAAATVALLSATEALFIVSVPPTRRMPPASAKRPSGAVTAARLPLISLFVIVSGPSTLRMPAPSASLARAPRPEALPIRLLLTVVSASVSDPQLSMPPPNAPANGQGWPSGHGGPTGAVALGATSLPLTTLFAIVTVAPPLKSLFGGISMPPPNAMTPSPKKVRQLVRVLPPVIVTPLIETVGSVAANAFPMVTTGPPPLMIVSPAAAP